MSPLPPPAFPRVRRALLLGGAALIAAAALSSCIVERELPVGNGQHPEGWTDAKSDDFHAKYIAQHGYPLQECQACHGADYNGGGVGVGCRDKKGCHEQSPDFCGTCHGGPSGPRPSTGVHTRHQAFCAECHKVPKQAISKGHMNGTVDVKFSGLAIAGGKKPTWSKETATCSGVYCHQDGAPVWKEPAAPLGCGGCHGAPPPSHVRWSFVAQTTTDCATCHSPPPDHRHIDGKVDLHAEIACNTCHGDKADGAPPRALDGSTDRSARGVGAHQRHLDAMLPDRLGRAVACASCHQVPSSVLSHGHLDTTAPATVKLIDDGTYDAATGSCVVSCHWDRAPGPVWTDTSGGARECDACHGFPPVLTRTGKTHTVVAPQLPLCLACHVFDPTTHIDGHVDLIQ